MFDAAYLGVIVDWVLYVALWPALLVIGAMGTGTDVALESAGITLVKGDLRGIVRARKLSLATMANIRQNITIALGLKAVFLVTTIAGITGLWPAILADTGATVLVTLNALRLLAPQTSR